MSRWYGNVSEDVGYVSPVFVDVPILQLSVTIIKEAYWFKLSHLVSTLQCVSGKPIPNRNICLFIEFDCLESYLQTCQNSTTSEFTQQVCCVDIALVIPLQPYRSYSKALELAFADMTKEAMWWKTPDLHKQVNDVNYPWRIHGTNGTCAHMYHKNQPFL